MDKTDTASAAQPSPPREGPSDAVAGSVPGEARRALVPYLVVATLGLLAALIVLVQLWAYRDELRTILTQMPV